MTDISEYVRALDQEIIDSAQLTHRQLRRPVRRNETPGTLAMQAMLEAQGPVDARRGPADGEQASTSVKLHLLEERLTVAMPDDRAGPSRVVQLSEPRIGHLTVFLSQGAFGNERNPVDGRPFKEYLTDRAPANTTQMDSEEGQTQFQEWEDRTVEVEGRRRHEPRTFTEVVGHEVLEVTQEGEIIEDGPHSKTKR